MNNYFKSLLGSILLFSCVENENPEPTDALDGELKITVSQSYAGADSELWIILNDIHGKAIESQRVSPGQTVTLKLDDSQRYHLTTYLLEESGGTRFESLETFANVSVSEDFILGLQEKLTPTPTIEGYFEVNVAGTEYPFGAYVTSRLGSYNSSAVQEGPQIQMETFYYSGVEDYLLVAQNNLGEGRYKFLSVPSAGEKLAYHFSELSAYDQVLKFSTANFSYFNFAAVALNEKSDDLESGFIVSSNRIGGTIDFQPLNFYEIGFLNRFETYAIYIEGKRPPGSKTSFAYSRIGTVPDVIVLPQDREIQVQKQGALDFQFSLPAGSTNWTALWYQSEMSADNTIKAFRRIITGSESSLYLELPENLTQGKPQLQDLSGLRLQSLKITTSTDSYDQQIRSRLVEIPKMHEMESSTIIRSF